MKTKKIISIILTFLLMFSFCSFSVSAVDGTGEFSAKDLSVSAYVTNNVDGVLQNTTVTNDLIISDVTTGTFKGFRKYSFPNNTDSVVRTEVTLTLSNKFEVRNGHEYNFKFKWGYQFKVPCTLDISLFIRDSSGNLVKTQSIYNASSPGYLQAHNIDFNFTPSVPETDSGYSCNFVIRFIQNYYESSSGNLQSFYLSPTLSLTDLDDDTGLINSIIEAIKAIPDRIKGFFTDLANSIGSFFQELADNIKGFFDSLKNYILYFQDPVTLNEDGVLVDANGNPIYVNPFENSIEDIKETFNGWIEDIRGFISGMDESRVQVSGYLQTGTGLINDILSASPIISAVLIFIASFFVIRKVVGR